MNCANAERLMQLELDGSLDAGARRRLESHLASCPQCRETWADYEAIADGVRTLDTRIVLPVAGGGRRWRIPALAAAALIAAAVTVALIARPKTPVTAPRSRARISVERPVTAAAEAAVRGATELAGTLSAASAFRETASTMPIIPDDFTIYPPGDDLLQDLVVAGRDVGDFYGRLARKIRPL